MSVSTPASHHPRLARRIAMLLALALAAAGVAHATETQWWTVDQASQYSEAELHGTTIRPEGVIELGPRAARHDVDSLGTIWAIAVMADGSVALAGDHGRVDRWTAAGGVRPWVKLASGQVLALAVDGDHLLAGTGPDGLIYRIGARGDTSLVVRTGERYVWGLAPGPKGSWYVATGTRGRLLRLQGRSTEVVLDTDESNLVSIVSDGAGGVYAGGDSKGRVVHVRANGERRTVFDAPEGEVRALALGADGALYAAALSSPAVSGAAAGGAVATGGSADDAGGTDSGEGAAAVPGVVVTAARGAGGRALVYRIVPDSSAAPWWVAPQSLIYALARTRDGLVAATGNRGGLYLLRGATGAMTWLSAPEGQLTALATDRAGHLFAAASNPAALWVVGPERAARGELLSPVLDARRLASWGHIGWRGAQGAHGAKGGTVELETRSGNTDHPDTLWTPWLRAERGRIASPPGRYLQWRATLGGGAPEVEAVDVAWRERNLAPRVDDVTVAPQGGAFREGELIPRSEPVTQTLPGGQKVEYSIPPASTTRQLRDLPAWARGIRTVQWKASDPNGDVLHYKVEVGPDANGPWTKLDDDLDAPTYSWDTHTLPDGTYRVRVTASDAAGNPLGEDLAGSAISEPFRVDNTPPAVTGFEAKAERGTIRITGRAADEASPIARIEVGLDNQDWMPVTPDGGFADERELGFHATIQNATPGDHQVGVRAVDLAGNSASRALHVTVPAR